MYRILPLVITLLPAGALASEAPAGPSPDIEVRQYDMEIGFRGRMLSIPRSVLDIWYFNDDAPGWPLDEGRPHARGYAVGIEYVIKGDGPNGVFYFEHMKSTMSEGYWDDVEDPPNHQDGSYVVPTRNFGMIGLGANFLYEVHLLRTEQTNGQFGLSLITGAGLGVGVVTGRLQEWGPDNLGRPGYERHAAGEDYDKYVRVPSVLPIVDVSAGIRFNIADRAVFRIEGGLHNLVYYGASAGLMF